MPSDPIWPFGPDEMTKLGNWIADEAFRIAGWLLTAAAAVLVKLTGAESDRDPKHVIADGIGTLALYHILVLVFVGLDLRWELALGLSGVIAVAGWVTVYRWLVKVADKKAGVDR